MKNMRNILRSAFFLASIFLVGLLTLLISFSNVAHAAVLDDGADQEEQLTARDRIASREEAGKKTPEYAQGEVIIKLKAKEGLEVLSEMSYSEKAAKDTKTLSRLKQKHGLRGERPVFKGLHRKLKAKKTSLKRKNQKPKKTGEADLLAIYVLKTDTDVLKTCAELNKEPDVEYAEPNHVYTIQAFPETLPDDTYINPSGDGVTWSEGAWGQLYEDMWGLRKMEANEAWPIAQGEDIVIAVIDTGVDCDHPDLSENMWSNAGEIPDNGIDDDGNGYIDDFMGWDFANNYCYPMDDNGHGTHCAGTIAAVGNNGIGLIGVAPSAKIMAVKGLDCNGRGFISRLVDAVYYAADNGADIISNSWGGSGSSQTLQTAFDYAHDEKGCVSLAAAGNDNVNVESFNPANIDSVIAVAASTQDDKMCGFSNYGFSIDVTAPGGGYEDELGGGWNDQYNILSTMSKLGSSYSELEVSEGYCRLAGTSMACPHAAGAAAVLKSMYPDDSPDAIRGRLMAGADSIDSLNPGHKGLLGVGRINVASSLAAEPGIILKVTGMETDNTCPGENSTIVFHIRNFWQDAFGVIASLSTDHPLVTVQNGEVAFGDILSGQTQANSADPFNVSYGQNIPFGEAIDFVLTMTCLDGYEKILSFTITLNFFENVGALSGLPLKDIMPWFTAMRDYDNDGYSDIYFAGYSTGDLYRNNGDGTFTNASAASGVGNMEIPWAQLFFDINNDGYQDMFLDAGSSGMGTRHGYLFLNSQDGTFAEITEESGLRDSGAVQAISFDYNSDGFADIFTGFSFEVNNGDNTFTMVSRAETGISKESPWQRTSFDYDNDGDQDLLYADYGNLNNILDRNNGDGTFSNVTTESGLTSFMGYERDVHDVAAGDYNNDGYIDVFMSYFIDRAKKYATGFLFKNNGDGTFTNVTEEAGNVCEMTGGFWWGTDFFDYDNDGDLDLYVTNLGAMPIPTNTLYRNNGDGTFTHVTDLAFSNDARPGCAAACIGDYNNDGALDIYAPSGLYGGDGALFKNRVGVKNNWIKIRLEGVESSRDAYGARVYVKTGDLRQLREVHTSPVETQPVHFGLGAETLIDEIEICWPSGIVQKLNNVDANQVINVIEPTATLPRIESIDPTWASIGDTITITGRNFGSTQGSSFVEFHENVRSSVTSWSDTEITCVVPESAECGNVYVTTDAGRSNGVYCTLLTVPPAPSDLEAEVTSRLVVYAFLSWRDHSYNEEGFKIERSATSDSDFIEIATVGSSVTEYYDEGLEPDTEYFYRIRAYNTGGDSDPSNVVSFVTGPAATSNSTGAYVDPDGVVFSWKDNSDNELGFRIYAQIFEIGVGFKWVMIADLDANTTAYTQDIVLPIGVKFFLYEIQAYNDIGESARVRVWVDASKTIPLAPSELKATALSQGEIALEWKYNSKIGYGTRIERSLSPTGDYTLIAAQNSTQPQPYVDTNELSPGTTYCYRAYTPGYYNNSDYSNIAEATTPMSPTDIIHNICLAIAAHYTNFLTPPDQVEQNFNLNNDRYIDGTDFAYARDIHILPYDKYIVAYTKLMAAVTERLGMTPADEKFISAFDVDGNGGIEDDDHATVSWALSIGRTSVSPTEIIQGICQAIAAHNTNFLTPPDQVEQNFNLNNDRYIDATDFAYARDIHSCLYDRYVIVYTKLMAAVTERLGMTPTDDKFISAFDVDEDGVIKDDDREIIAWVLSIGRL